MRILLPVLFGLALCAVSTTAQSDEGGAMGQLENATSGNQTLDQTYGDNGDRDIGCPDACPTGGGDVPDANPPAPVEDSGSDDNG